jgi:gluconolactonase
LFTDPPFGLNDYEGERVVPELPTNLYRFDPANGTLRVMSSDILAPNRLAFSPDGLRCDEDGNLWCGWGTGSSALDGVMIFSPAGAPIGRIALPERCANLCFGGLKRNRLFMAASQSLYALYVNTRGAV